MALYRFVEVGGDAVLILRVPESLRRAVRHVAPTTLKLEKCSFGGIKLNLFQWQTVHAAAAEEATCSPNT